MGKQAFRLGTFAALAFSLAVPVRAGVERWTPYGPPEGFLVTMAVDGDRLLAATGESGVFASTDKGLTWFRSSEGMDNEWIEAIVVDSDDHTLHAAGRHRFFQSLDAGAHWTALGTLPAREEPGDGETPVHDVLVLVPGEPDVFLLSVGKILYRSTDGGRTWASVLTWTTAIQAVLVDPNDPRSLFAGTRGPDAGLLHSPDAGATWTPVTDVQSAGPPPEAPPFNNGVREITAAATEPTTLFAVSGDFALYRSLDAGATWREIRLPPPGNGAIVSVVAAPGRHPRIYTLQYPENYVLNQMVLSASDDLGDTWAVSTKAARGTGLRIDPATGALYSLDPSGVGIAEEDGASWQFSPLGGTCGRERTGLPLPSVHFAPGRTYVLVGGRLWVSRDGQRWTVLARNFVDRCIGISELTVDPRPGVLWALADRGLYRSEDGGLTWNRFLRGGWPTNRDFLEVARLDARTILVSGSGMWRSDDRGVTWTRTMSRFVQHDEFDEPEFQRYLYRLRAEPGNPKVVYAEAVEFGERHPPLDFQYIYQSLDGGLTWHRLVEGVFGLAFDPARPRTLYGLGYGALLRSTDRGRHWKKISDRPVYSVWDRSDLVVDPNDPRVLYLARSGFKYDGPREELGVWRSTDGGITWAPLRLGMGILPVYKIAPDPRQPGRLFATSSEGLFVGRFALPGD